MKRNRVIVLALVACSLLAACGPDAAEVARKKAEQEALQRKAEEETIRRKIAGAEGGLEGLTEDGTQGSVPERLEALRKLKRYELPAGIGPEFKDLGSGSRLPTHSHAVGAPDAPLR